MALSLMTGECLELSALLKELADQADYVTHCVELDDEEYEDLVKLQSQAKEWIDKLSLTYSVSRRPSSRPCQDEVHVLNSKPYQMGLE